MRGLTEKALPIGGRDPLPPPHIVVLRTSSFSLPNRSPRRESPFAKTRGGKKRGGDLVSERGREEGGRGRGEKRRTIMWSLRILDPQICSFEVLLRASADGGSSGDFIPFCNRGEEGGGLPKDASECPGGGGRGREGGSKPEEGEEGLEAPQSEEGRPRRGGGLLLDLTAGGAAICR